MRQGDVKSKPTAESASKRGRVDFRLPISLIEKLDTAAAALGMDRTALIEALLERHLLQAARDIASERAEAVDRLLKDLDR